MRLSELQRGALRKALDGVDGRAYLYGSRTDDSRRGGDVDVLIFSDADPHRLSADVRVRYRMECDERIDVLVVNPARIDSEQRAFLNIIEKDILPINGEISEVNPMGSNDSVSGDGAGAGARENGEDMSERQRRLIGSAAGKATAAAALVGASLAKVPAYSEEEDYSADEREPYDALTDRFIRAVEMCLQFFRRFERLEFGEESLTLRDRLNRMERLGLITSVELWMKMRDVRNRAVHDYQPDQLKRMYDDMMEIFGPELLGCAGEIEKVLERR